MCDSFKNRSMIFIIGILVISLFLSACEAKEDVKEEEPAAEIEEEAEVQEPEEEEEVVLEELPVQMEEPEVGEEIAIIKTNKGAIKLRLFEDVAPKAVENFKTHAKNGYYDGLTFHRVMEEFMIQGGDPQGTGAGGESIWGENFEDEFNSNYRNYRGALSMANAGPGTNGSQFFIVQNSKVDSNYWLELDEVIDQIIEAGEEEQYKGEINELKEMKKYYKALGGAPWLDGKHTVFGHVIEGMDIVDKIAAVEVDGQYKPLEDVIMETIEIAEYK